ncbi:MAG: pyruvate synthase subunit beta [Armatimonadetes bacterium]|nr:pyruvate synthase subunit beta [Armatimonadota bacterium]
MEKLARQMGLLPLREEMFAPGHNACPGCGSTIALRMVLNAVGERAICLVPASCASLYVGPGDTSAASVPVIHTLFAGCFAEAEGMARGLHLQGRDEKVVVWAGDGCCYDIALGALSGTAARGADILVVCNDNEGYQNTGGHQSTATPPDAATRTGRRSEHALTPVGRKDLVEIIAAHRVPYVATASAAFPQDLAAKMAKAAQIRGFRMIVLLTPCVTWGYDSRHSVKLARLAVETGYFPLYEVEWGRHYRVSHEPAMLPLEMFTRLQKRFHGADLDAVYREVQAKWEDLRFNAGREAAALGEGIGVPAPPLPSPTIR